MSMLRTLSKEQIQEDFTHVGWLLSVLPVYVCDPYSNVSEAVICERNGWPEYSIPLLCGAWNVLAWIVNFGGLLPAFEVRYPILITGEIVR